MSEPSTTGEEPLATALQRAGVLFVDIPRTSSSSIRTELAAHFGFPFGKANVTQDPSGDSQGYEDHLTAVQWQQRLGAHTWAALHRFSIVRNPWDRQRSFYAWRCSRFASCRLDLSFEAYLEALHRHRCQGEPSPLFAYPPSAMSCLDFLQDPAGLLLVDEVFQFERRQQAMLSLSQRLGFRLGSCHIQQVRDSGPGIWSGRLRRLVAETFSDDLAAFGY
jgi:hypothetical protein